MDQIFSVDSSHFKKEEAHHEVHDSLHLAQDRRADDVNALKTAIRDWARRVMAEVFNHAWQR